MTYTACLRRIASWLRVIRHCRSRARGSGDAPLASRQHLANDGSSLSRRLTGKVRTFGPAVNARLVVCIIAGGGSDPAGRGKRTGEAKVPWRPKASV